MTIIINDAMLEKSSDVQKESIPQFESHMSAFPLVTIFFMGGMILVFILQLVTGLDAKEGLTQMGSLIRSHVLMGEWYRLVSMMFLHGGIDHIMSNIIALYVVGMAGEHAFGKLHFSFLFFFTGVVAAGTSMAVYPGPSVGASGALFGIMGAVAAYVYRKPTIFSDQEKRIGGILIAWAIYAIAQGFLTPYVDNAAHIGGFVAGYLCISLLVKKDIKEYN